MKFKVSLISFALLITTACSDRNVIVDPDPTCDGAVQIGLHDGVSEILCGCAEAVGTQAFAPDTLTCTLNSGTPFHFFYLGRAFTQQVRISFGGDNIYTGPFFDPFDLDTPAAGSVDLADPGTYTLTTGGLTVSIIVL